jgi:hypothetical protein
MELCAKEGSMIAILLTLGGLSKAEVVEKATKSLKTSIVRLVTLL